MDTDFDRGVASVRRFNRLYTKRIGVVRDDLLETEFNLTEARLIYEIGQNDGQENGLTASDLARELGLDAGYLSRTLRSFRRRGLLAASAAPDDRRRSLLSLTRRGRAAYAKLDARSDAQVAHLLESLPPDDRNRMIAAVGTIENLLAERASEPYMLRGLRSGDLGWIVHRHAVLYLRAHGWGLRFETLVAEIVAKSMASFDPARDGGWIAERDGEIVGSVMLFAETKRTARLRLFLVEPSARGLGIGTRLLDESIRFARAAGYRKIVLWTQSVLVEARRLYERAGFRLVRSEHHAEFGVKLIGETWELPL